MTTFNLANTQIILGNSSKRFSGVTSTMLQVLKHQQALAPTAILGSHHLSEDATNLSFSDLVSLCKKPLPDNKSRVFHARRNDEMIQALVAKKIFGAKIKIAFTSTAQRHHSKFTRYLMRQMDGIITTNQRAASFLTDRPADVIIPHGVDTQTYMPADDRQKAWQALGLPGKYGIGIFGRVRESKGIDIFVDASLPLMREFPDVTVVICGQCLPQDQSFKDALLKKIESAGLSDRYIFLGEQPFTEIPGLFRAMTIVAALSREEGFGLTPLEAMASGCAVLTSEAGAWKEIIRDGIDGYCIPIADINATREKLHLLISDIQKTEMMGTQARTYVEDNFDTAVEAKRLTDYLLSLRDAP